MAQAITDVKTFLEDARQAVVELAEFENRRRRLLRKRKASARAGDGAESGGGCREFDREKAPG